MRIFANRSPKKKANENVNEHRKYQSGYIRGESDVVDGDRL